MEKTTTELSILGESYTLTPDQIAFYRENRYIKLKQVLPPEVLSYYANVIHDKVKELNTMHLPLAERDTYSKAFLQVMNLWRKSEEIKRLVFSKRLARIAAELMGVSGVRLYHDQALFKEPGGGFTPWHADQYYWPFVERQRRYRLDTPAGDSAGQGPLEFSAQSHRLNNGRGLKISDESERQIEQMLREGGFQHIVEPFELGEASFHSGWLFHRAGANTTNKMRQVMTVIYMDKDMRLKAPENSNQQADWDTWCPGAEVGEVIDTALNPVLYSPS